MDKEFVDFFENNLITNFTYKDDLIFICRSGVRSRIADKISIKVGFINVYNIHEGFEGIANFIGWKNNGLPWKVINF